MGHYQANLRDIEFMLFEVLRRDQILGIGRYPDVDAETARSLLREVEHLATTTLADAFAVGDRTPPVYDPSTHSVTMPQEFAKAFHAYTEGGWPDLDLTAELGGTPVPPSLRWAVAEMVLGANPAVHLYSTGPAFARLVHDLGTDEQKQWAQVWAQKRWSATMVLTEPDAGSDVGAGRTSASPQPDGSWHINGVKRFITSGEHDMTDNIIHLVLARPEGAGPGTKGLSLFIVPKFHVDWETGDLLDRNGVYATNVEHKMGLKASTTCELTFGEHEPAVGWLVGDVHDGIAQMFKVIEYARMLVGSKAIATLSAGYLNALEYTKTRVQGPDLTRASDKTAPRVPVIDHPDVRRSLMTQKAYSEGLRALMLYAASVQDAVEVKEESGEDATLDHALNDLLLPVVKGYGSEKSYGLLAESLQCFGGSGYLQDYPIEQYIRDAKIDTLYEGTTAIQGLDLFFRKMVKDDFRAITALGQEIGALALTGRDELARERQLLGGALQDVQAMIAAMATFARAAAADPEQIYRAGLNTTRLLFAVGDVVVAWLLLRQATVALVALEGDASASDQEFYRGKVAAAQWFCRQVLPHISAERAVLEATDLDVMDLPETAF
jgi:alkylation response protein AidB-like acyl-CoA dehydrogenase